MGEAKAKRTEDWGKPWKTLIAERKELLDQLCDLYVENGWVRKGSQVEELRESFRLSNANQELREKLFALRS